ncbi:MAG: DUF4340 domain-containing protein, partial [Candidatus Krumholzibacteria bacterium]|nr:DUF4340 domain-containing protein [Candidatus Krumholzibacteria bacterium]
MRSKPLIALVALLVAVAGYFFLVEQRGRRRSEESRRSSKLMLPYGPSDVNRAWLLNPYGETIEVARSGDAWTVLWPVTDEGDSPAVEMLLRQIVPGQKLAEYPDVERLSDYGLVAPYATVILQSERYGRTDTVHIGDKAPTSYRAYARLGGSRTVVLTRDLARNVTQKTLFHLRDKNFIHLPPETVTRLAVRSPGARVGFARSGSEWILGGSTLRVDRSLLETYLPHLTDAVVYEFAAEDPADTSRFGIGDPPRELVLHSRDGATRISFGARNGDFVPVLRDGRRKVMMIESRFLDPFSWVRDDLVVMSLSTAMPGEVAALTWESPDTTLSLELSGDRWRSIDPAVSAVDGEAVKYLLMLLRSTRFESLVEDGEEAAGILGRSPGVRIVLLGRGGEGLD